VGTQQFNTTTSMGRLVLSILLSFAQFEREIIGERIRDKIAATKRKGKHCGGMPVLGYLPAYLAEYRLIYGDILARGFLPKPLNVLSIGCGCGVDYWGLHFAARDDHASYSPGLRYTGLDTGLASDHGSCASTQSYHIKRSVQ
jgi:hypothetical protein